MKPKTPMVVSVDKGIPFPGPVGFKRGDLRRTLDQLDVGDSALVTGGVYRSIVAHVFIVNRDYAGERRYSLRSMKGGDVRIWRME